MKVSVRHKPSGLAKPFRFWINDSKESGDIVSGAGDQIPGKVFDGSWGDAPNSAHSQIQGRSDLVNFFPVALDVAGLLEQFPLTNGYEFHLSQADYAVKFVYTSLTNGNAFEYLTNTASVGYGVNADEGATNASKIIVTADSGVMVDTNWLARAQAGSGAGVLLLEGRFATSNPLWLDIWRKDDQGILHKLGGVPLYLKIDGGAKKGQSCP